jgi:hypothetical protein
LHVGTLLITGNLPAFRCEPEDKPNFTMTNEAKFNV